LFSLNDLFAKKTPSMLGLDISASSVKVLELSKQGEHYRVERYAVEPMPQNAMVESTITEVEQVSDTVGRAVKKSGSKCKHVAVAVAGSHVISKIIQMPINLNDNELHQQIELEADRYVPYPLDEVNLDFSRQGATDAANEQQNVLLAACRKEIVDDGRCALRSTR
jgi:type IV pilus assembly protein PilM